jgi:hypothetical protein
MSTQNTYKHPLMQRQLDGGYSGALTVSAGRINDGTTMLSVDSELLGNLVLTARRAAALSTALADAAAEGLPPSESSLKAFRVVFGHDAEPEQTSYGCRPCTTCRAAVRSGPRSFRAPRW